MKIIFIISTLIIFCLCNFNLFAQSSTDIYVNGQNITNGTHYFNYNTTATITAANTSPTAISDTAFVQFLGGTKVVLKPGFSVTNLSNGGLFHASTQVVQGVTFNNLPQAVHPDIQQIDNNLYRMVFTRYDNGVDSYENPNIIESTDGINFTDPTGVSNPLVPTPNNGHVHNHNCDVDYIKENGSEYIYYVECWDEYTNPNRIIDLDIHLLKSTNNWQSFTNNVILGVSNSQQLPFYNAASPAIIKKDNLYYLFYVNIECYDNVSNGFSSTPPETTTIQYINNNSLENNWSFISGITQGNNISINLNGLGAFYPWHINIIYNSFDDNYYMLITGKKSPIDGYDSNNDLYIAKSCDLINWDLYPNPIISKDDVGETQIYRSAGLFKDNNTIDIYLSYQTGNQWYIVLWKNMSTEGMFSEDLCSNKKELSQNTIVNNQNNISEKTKELNKVNIRVYPNPTKDYIIIENIGNDFINANIEIYDIVGHKISTTQLLGNKTEVSLTNLATGMYSYQIKSNNIIVEKNVLIINN